MNKFGSWGRTCGVAFFIGLLAFSSASQAQDRTVARASLAGDGNGTALNDFNDLTVSGFVRTIAIQDPGAPVPAPGGGILSFADAGGGNVTVTTDAPHGLVNGDEVTISGTAAYNGAYIISNAAASSFDITPLFGFDGDETGSWVVNVRALICVYDDPVTVGGSDGCGGAGSITSFADAGGGFVTVTAEGVDMVNGATVTITDTTNYNGSFAVSNVVADTSFDITAAFVADDMAGNWAEDVTGRASLSGDAPSTGSGLAVKLERRPDGTLALQDIPLLLSSGGGFEVGDTLTLSADAVRGIEPAVLEVVAVEIDWDTIYDECDSQTAIDPPGLCVPENTGAARQAFASDTFTPGNEISYFKQGNSDVLPISDWGCVNTSNPTSKADLRYTYGALYEDQQSYTDPILYVGADKDTFDGTTFLGIWLLQDDVGCINDGTGPSEQPFFGRHRHEDLLIQVNIESAGSEIAGYRWIDPDALINDLLDPSYWENGDECLGRPNEAWELQVQAYQVDPVTNPIGSITEDPCAFAEGPGATGGSKAESELAGIVCGEGVQSAEICAIANNIIGAGDPADDVGPLDDNPVPRLPWRPAEIIEENGFVEAGINLVEAGFQASADDFISGQTNEECFATVMIETRSSAQFTASLKDFSVLDIATCGSITVVKDSSEPPGAAFDFRVSPAADNISDFQLAVGQSLEVFTPSGSYRFSEEAVPAGGDWNLENIACVDQNGAPANFTTTIADGAVTGIADGGGTGIEGDPFKALVTSAGHGLSAGDRVYISGTPSYDGGYNVDVVDADTFSIEIPAAAVPDTYDDAEWNARFVDVTIDASQDLVCTFTNELTPPPGGFVVTKGCDTVNSPTDTFEITLAGDFSSSSCAAGPVVLSCGESFACDGIQIDEAYTIQETSIPAGWELTDIVCQDGASNPTGVCGGDTATITLTNDTEGVSDTATVTFTNTEDASIVVTKMTDPASEGPAFDFLIAVADGPPNPFSLSHMESTEPSAVPPGEDVLISETVPAGYVLSQISCTGANWVISGANNVTVTPVPGESVECTFTNTLQRGSITIEKNAVGGDGLFGFIQDYKEGSVNINTESGILQDVTTDVLPGQYTITEVLTSSVPAFDLTEISCTDEDAIVDLDNKSVAITLDPNENITCTFTNTARGAIVVVKEAIGGDGIFSFVRSWGAVTEFDIETTNGSGQRNYQDTVPGSGYSVSEADPGPDWSLESATCDSGQNPDDITLDPGATVTCTFVNRKLEAEISIVKSPNTQIVDPQGTAVFQIEVTNTGEIDLVNVTVSDPKAPDCDLEIGDLAVGNSEAYECSLPNVIVGLVNVATACGDPESGGDEVCDSDTASVAVNSVEVPVDSAWALLLMFFGTLAMVFARRRELS